METDPKLKERLVKYLKKAENKFKEATISPALSEEQKKISKKIIEYSLNYFDDAKHFYDKGMLIDSFAALEYAEGYLDAGIHTGLIQIK